MSNPPSGTVTFLFTNIEGSTKRLGDEAFEQARNEGRAMSVEEAIAYALEETTGSQP
jgi:hypothetical protein